jgi:hypothetical protein
MTSHIGPDPMVLTHSCLNLPRLTAGCTQERNLYLATLSSRLFCEFPISGYSWLGKLLRTLTVAGIRKLATWGIETLVDDRIFADTARFARVKTVGEYTELVAQRDEFIRSFNEQVCRLL